MSFWDPDKEMRDLFCYNGHKDSYYPMREPAVGATSTETKGTGNTSRDPLREQEGGSHYKTMKIQPVEFALANDMGFIEGCVVKYVSRYTQKGGLEDLRKARHFLDILIQDIENKKNVTGGSIEQV